MTVSQLASEVENARLPLAPWHFCSVVPAKIDGEDRLPSVVAEDFHQMFEQVLGILQEVTRLLLRALACHWGCPLLAKQQEMAIPLTTVRMRVHP